MDQGRNHMEVLEGRIALSLWGIQPAISAPNQIRTSEDTATPVHIRVSDVPNKTLTVTITASEGLLHTGKYKPPAQRATLKGTAPQINRALRTLAYHPPKDSNNPETITVAMSNGTRTASKNTRVNITPVNDPPSIDHADPEMTSKDEVAWRNPVISDPDSESIKVEIRSDKGEIRIQDPRATHWNGAATIQGDARTINQTLQSKVRITGAPHGKASITIRASDGRLSAERKFSLIVKEDLKEHAARAIRYRTEGKSPNESKPLFSLADHATPRYQRNEASWTAGLDMTPISPWNSHGGERVAGTLVSPRHIVYATHFQMPVGTRVRFVAKDNSVVERTIAAKISPQYTQTYFPDITVALLDSEVPDSIAFARVLPEDWRRYLEERPNLPCLTTDQEEKALVTNLQHLGDYASFNRPAEGPEKDFFENIIAGDSGNPAFMVVDDQLVLLTVWTFGYGGSGTSIEHQRNQINLMMRNLGCGYQLQEASLDRFATLKD